MKKESIQSFSQYIDENINNPKEYLTPDFSEIKDQLEKHKIVVLSSGKETIKTCLDKLKFSKLEGINAIPTSENIEDLNLDRFVVKERFGAGTKKIGITWVVNTSNIKQISA